MFALLLLVQRSSAPFRTGISYHMVPRLPCSPAGPFE
jgi:hypothetical protein